MAAFVVLLLALCRLLRVLSLNEDGLHLLRAKESLDDPDGVLRDWNSQDGDACNWTGITCSAASRRVTGVEISDTRISGPFPSFLCRLPELASLSLSNNYINSSLSNNIAGCGNLRRLDLSQNLLVESIPESVTFIDSLQHLNLSGNNFTGDVPATFGRLRLLQVLDLTNNLLNGTSNFLSLANITSLRFLNLAYNPFSQSRLPPEIGNLTNLEQLWLTQCNLAGGIPATVGTLSKLVNLDLAINSLAGTIPDSIVELKNLVQIELYRNELAGFLPVGMSNMTALRRVDAAMNDLAGFIPADLCDLPLESLNLYQNRFYGHLPESISRSPNLQWLRLFDNRLNGSLPVDLGKYSPLRVIDVSGNGFSGEIPEGICSKGTLTQLLMINTSLSGKVPRSLGECQSLMRVRLSNNRFSGEIPASLWSLRNVYLLELTGNSFSGPVPGAISSMYKLSSLLISKNQFNGSIPEEIGSLSSLIVFSGGDNLFTGEVPTTIINLTKLERLDLNDNQLSGEITAEIGGLKRLFELNLANNDLSGSIPDEIGSLTTLNYLDLSGNCFSGKIPLSLQNLKLNLLNLSSNNLSGEVPDLFLGRPYRDSFSGNPHLCGRTYGSCVNGGSDDQRSSSRLSWIRAFLFFIPAGFVVVGLSCCYSKYREIRKTKNEFRISDWKSFQKLDFVEFEILEFLKEENVIGRGSSGKVYRADVLRNGEAVAVKKLWKSRRKTYFRGDSAGERDEFQNEVETLGKIRHKNIVKLLSCCNARGLKLLVYEYMPNGSLGDLLHGGKGETLHWSMRYSIALNAAVGLSYLHHDCVPAIIHRDVKSNNILLDSEFGAKLSDFGIAKFIRIEEKQAESMSAVAGSYGYIAPEYAYTFRVNEKSDIYSFGVVLLELVTGRRPSDPEFGERGFLEWVSSVYSKEGFEQLVDSRLRASTNNHKEDMRKVLNVGLRCASTAPAGRPSMRQVVRLLLEISPENALRFVVDDDGKLSPAFTEDGSSEK